MVWFVRSHGRFMHGSIFKQTEALEQLRVTTVRERSSRFMFLGQTPQDSWCLAYAGTSSSLEELATNWNGGLLSLDLTGNSRISFFPKRIVLLNKIYCRVYYPQTCFFVWVCEVVSQYAHFWWNNWWSGNKHSSVGIIIGCSEGVKQAGAEGTCRWVWGSSMLRLARCS